LAADLFGRHVIRSAEHHAGLRSLGARHVAHARDAEVEHFDRPVHGNEDVLGLDVTVDDPLGVRRAEDVEELIAHGEHFVQGKAASQAIAPHFERLAFEELHDEKDAPVLGDVIVEDPHRSRVPHRIGDVALAKETRTDVGVAGEVQMEHLDGDAVAVSVRRGIHRGRTSGPEAGIKPPLVLDDGANSALHAVHGRAAATRGAGRVIPILPWRPRVR